MKRASLVIGASGERQTAYRCSICGRTFSLCEDLTPKEMMATLLETFNDHVRMSHSDHAVNTNPPDENEKET